MTLHVVISGHGEYRQTRIDVPPNIGIRFYVNEGVALRDRVGGLVEARPDGDYGAPPQEIAARIRGTLALEHIFYEPRRPTLQINRSDVSALQFMAALDKAVLLSEFLAWLHGHRPTLVAQRFLAREDEQIRIHWCACRVLESRRPSAAELRMGVGMRLILCNQAPITVAAFGVRLPGRHEMEVFVR